MIRKCLKLSSLRSVLSCQFHCYSSQANVKEEPTALQKFLYKKIRLNGPIPVSEFMEEALTNPKYGYYTTRDPLGKEGDFITTPEISQLFGEILAFWSVDYWQNDGMVKDIQFIELGPGRGTMAEDMTRTLGELKPKVLKETKVTLNMVEVSPTLAQKQFRRLCVCENEWSTPDAFLSGKTKHGFNVNWYNTLDKVPDDKMTFLFAHEFFDALPIRKFQRQESTGKFHEIYVDVDPAENEDCASLRFVILPNPNVASSTLISKKEWRDHVEVCPRGGVMAQEIAKRINKSGGAALIMDYGHFGAKGDTLRAFTKHQLCNVLTKVGDVDITADVDFKYLDNSVRQTKAFRYGPISQSRFLRSMGIDYLHQRLLKQCRTVEQQKQVNNSYRWMTDDKKMGSRFQFYAMGSKKRENKLSAVRTIAGFH